MTLVIVTFEAAGGGSQNQDNDRDTSSMCKSSKRCAQEDVQPKADAKSEATGKGEGDAPADAQKQHERYAQRDVQSNAEAKDHAESRSKAEVKTKVEGSHRQAVMGKAAFIIKKARGNEKCGKRERDNLKSRRKDTLSGKALKEKE